MQIDIEKIKENISTEHGEFLKELGCHSDRVLAEHSLVMELTFARIKFICESFTKLGIIDNRDEREKPRKIYLSKGGYDNYVSISTNGDRIIIDGASYLTSMKEIKTEKVLLDGASKDDFDWVNFADKLLEMVHGCIYERREAMETKVFKR